MKKELLAILSVIFILASCEEKAPENLMTVSGTIDGLKKGTLFLQKVNDSSLVTLDSLELRGDGTFSFSQVVDQPEVFYLYLEKADNNDINDRLTFFGETGEINIKTAWNTFDTNAKVSGSESHEKYQEFQDMLTKFNLVDLELIKESLQEEMQQDSLKMDSLVQLSDANLKRKYRYILNFAFNNLDTPVTPYVVLNHAQEANPKYLDSIAKSMPDSIAQTKYGKALTALIKTTTQ